MRITTKRILILFSVCLNIGFVASGLMHHLLGPPPGEFKPFRILKEAVHEIDMSDAQREAMQAIQDRIRQSNAPFKDEISDVKRDFFEALSAPGGPDEPRLDVNMETEMRMVRSRISEFRGMFREILDVLGPEKTRQLGMTIIRKHRHP